MRRWGSLCLNKHVAASQGEISTRPPWRISWPATPSSTEVWGTADPSSGPSSTTPSGSEVGQQETPSAEGTQLKMLWSSCYTNLLSTERITSKYQGFKHISTNLTFGIENEPWAENGKRWFWHLMWKSNFREKLKIKKSVCHPITAGACWKSAAFSLSLQSLTSCTPSTTVTTSTSSSARSLWSAPPWARYVCLRDEVICSCHLDLYVSVGLTICRGNVSVSDWRWRRLVLVSVGRFLWRQVLQRLRKTHFEHYKNSHWKSIVYRIVGTSGAKYVSVRRTRSFVELGLWWKQQSSKILLQPFNSAVSWSFLDFEKHLLVSWTSVNKGLVF